MASLRRITEDAYDLNIVAPDVIKDMNPGEWIKYRALTALYRDPADLQGPAYSGMYKIRNELFEKAKAACAEVDEDFMNFRAFTDLISKVGYSCRGRGT
jgi:hypothetical protein